MGRPGISSTCPFNNPIVTSAFAAALSPVKGLPYSHARLTASFAWLVLPGRLLEVFVNYYGYHANPST
jgi:hypothetical protein